MTLTLYVSLATFLLGAELLYLRLARRLGIVDTPNARSSHTDLTIRGGGVLFFVAALLAFVYVDCQWLLFLAGLTLVTVVSFLDDLRPLANRYRIGTQVVAMALLLRETGAYVPDGWSDVLMLGAVLLVGVGTLNAYNFMDGINGITALYSLVAVLTLWFWNAETAFAPDVEPLLAFVVIALLIFSFFNVRPKAVCFAGDVGSVSVGFIIVYALLRLSVQAHTYLPVLLLSVYGIDSVLTIVHRLYLRQNIFKAHRLHLFQLLVHRAGWPHLRVSVTYALVQAGINVVVLAALHWPVQAQWVLAATLLGALAVCYVALKRRLMAKWR